MRIKNIMKDFLGLSLLVLYTVIPMYISFARAVSFGALRGCVKMNFAPLEGVADKQQSGENRLCLQRRFVERLAWEPGEGFPLLYSVFINKQSKIK